MTQINEQLPKNVVEFCALFPPSARLCRFVNRRSGTLLDIRDINGSDVPVVVGNQESNGVQYWLITPYGSGQAIIPVPKDGSQKVRYLTPSSPNLESAVTVSPFPTSWNLLPTADCPPGDPLVGYSVPQGLYEEWTCLISWPHFRSNEARMLDLHSGVAEPNRRVVSWVFTGLQWQYWRVQFIRYRRMDSILPVLPSTSSTVIVPSPLHNDGSSCGTAGKLPGHSPSGIVNSAISNSGA